MRLTFPRPARPWSVNDDRMMHWGARRRLVEAWKAAAWVAALQAKAQDLSPAEITVVIPFDKGGRRDPHNYVTVAKAIVDGLVQAKAWPDDTPEYVTVHEPILVVSREADVEVLIEERQSLGSQRP